MFAYSIYGSVSKPVEISVADQTMTFLGSILLGLAFGVFYEAFRLLRLIFKPGAVSIFFQDMIFFITCALRTYSFMLSRSSGEPRGFIVLGVVLGFAVYFLTVGVMVVKISKQLIDAVNKAAAWVYKIFLRPILLLIRIIEEKCKNSVKKIVKNIKFPKNNSKIDLQSDDSIMYNKRHKTQNKETRPILHRGRKKERMLANGTGIKKR